MKRWRAGWLFKGNEMVSGGREMVGGLGMEAIFVGERWFLLVDFCIFL